MSRIEAVRLLIKRYNEKAAGHRLLSQEYEEKAKEMEAYLYELTAPGFMRGRKRFTKQGRTENYVIQAQINE